MSTATPNPGMRRLQRRSTRQGRATGPASPRRRLHLDLAFETVVGEDLSVIERLVVSPCPGALRVREVSPGQYVTEGDVVARVVGTDGQTVTVHTPFAGTVMGYLLPHGSPVRMREPLVWLRTE